MRERLVSCRTVQPPPSPGTDRFAWAWLPALVLVGAAHWAWVFGLPPRLPRDAADWPKEIRYYAVLKQAVSEGRVPYYVSQPVQETRKFLAIPETVLSPQIVLLRWLDADAFLLANVVLLHAMATLAVLLARRRYGLSAAMTVFLWLLVVFNGHVVAHLAIGHSMWGGVFLLPWLVLLVLDRGLVPPKRWPIAVGVLLAAMLLQGSYHVFVWGVLLLVLTLAFQPERRPVLEALAWSAALGLVRLVPTAAILLGRRETGFQTGYPDLATLVAGLAQIRDVAFPRVGAGSMGGLQWWEFDHYLGPAAALWLMAVGGREAWRRRWTGPIAILTVFAFTAGYRWVSELGVPLLSTERVSSRFLIVPLTLLAFLAAPAAEAWRRAGTRRRSLAVWGLAGVTATCLAAHTQAWTMRRVAALSPAPPHERDLAIAIVSAPPDMPRDALYVASVQLSALGSAVALGLAAWRWRVSRGSSR
jgi:hypothetical protein